MKKLMFAVVVILTGCGGNKICSPAGIAEWERGYIGYAEQTRADNAETVMARGTADCKGYAVVSMQRLRACGIEGRIVKLSPVDNKGPGHVVVTFRQPNGERGYISGGRAGVTWELFPLETPWAEIIRSIDGGKWEANFTE